MKYKFQYWDKSTFPKPAVLLFEIIQDTTNVVTADKAFTDATGTNPVKSMNVGLSLVKIDEV